MAEKKAVSKKKPALTKAVVTEIIDGAMDEVNDRIDEIEKSDEASYAAMKAMSHSRDAHVEIATEVATSLLEDHFETSHLKDTTIPQEDGSSLPEESLTADEIRQIASEAAYKAIDDATVDPTEIVAGESLFLGGYCCCKDCEYWKAGHRNSPITDRGYEYRECRGGLPQYQSGARAPRGKWFMTSEKEGCAQGRCKVEVDVDE